MFQRKKFYTVHLKTDTNGEMQDVVFVREGFNIYAFALSIFWAVFARAWLFAAMIFMWMIVLQLVKDQALLYPLSISVLQMGIMMVVGFLANDALRDSLKQRGYTEEGVVSGENQLRAEQRFFDHYTAMPA